jgi:serine/threonine protein kinase
MEFYGLKKLSSSNHPERQEACPYSLERLIQTGKRSVRILQAYSSDSSDPVAIKLFPKDNQGESLQEFINEEAMIANLSHPHILKYHDTFSNALVKAPTGKLIEYSAIIMEFIQCGDLYGLVALKSFSEQLARTLFKQMISATKYMHNQELVHLDMKLENFMITLNEGVKLIDFETCYRIDKDIKIASRGTPGYRAPELLDGRVEDAKALDMYSLGVMLFTMVAGHPPYEEKHDNGKWKFDGYYEALRHDTGKFWRAHERTRENEGLESFSSEFKEIIESLLQVDANKRPSAHEIRRMRWYQREVFSNEDLEKELLIYFEAS